MKATDFFRGSTISTTFVVRSGRVSPGRRVLYRVHALILATTLVLATCLPAGPAHGHGERPQVMALTTGHDQPETTWVLTDNQGVFANIKDGFRWLCEDAIAPSAGIRGLAVYGSFNQRMVAATTAGLFTSEDGGCQWMRGVGDVGAQRLIGLWPGTDPTDLITASDHPLVRNDVYRSLDGGRSWLGARVSLSGPVEQLLRGTSAPSRVYLQSEGHLWVSHDAGASFMRLPALIAPGRLLAMSPTDPNVLFVSTEAIPHSTVWRSTDAGATWEAVLEVADLDLKMVIHPNGEDILLNARLIGSRASTDSGLTWGEGPSFPPAVTALANSHEGRLLVSTDVYSGGPWVLGQSLDWGQTWSPILQQFWDAEERWDCGPNTRGHACCRGLCPGRPVGAECGQTAPPATQAECAPSPPDARPPTEPADGTLDGSTDTDSGQTSISPDPTPTSGGCNAVLQSRGWPWGFALFVLVLVVTGRRKRRPRPCG